MTAAQLRQPPTGPRPFRRLIDLWQAHCENVHDYQGYTRHVIGWHRDNHPECHRNIFPEKEPWWTDRVR